MKKLFVVLIVSASLYSTAGGQSLSPSATPGAGGYATGGGVSLSWAMGEMFTATLSSTNNKLSQGMQQPEVEINTGTLSSTLYAGHTVSIPFTPYSIITGSNTFTAQLSDATGSFASPVNIGTLTGNSAGTIAATIPAGTAAGTRYRIRVVANMPVYNGTNNGNDLAIGLLSNAWTGAISTDWNTAANWSVNIVPAATDNVDIPSTGVTNEPLVSTAAATRALTIGTGRTLTINNTGTIGVAGDVTSSGVFDASAGGITLNGTAAQTITGSITVKNLTVNNTAGVVLFSGATRVLGTYTPQAGTLNANGKLVMASTAAGTSNIAQGSGNYLTGGITVERYIPARRAWRMLTAPLSQTGTIYNNWQNGGIADGTSGAVIFKPHASGTDGYTAGGGEASMEYYDEVQDKWLDVANTNATSLGNNNTSAANQAYAMFITGPYGSNTIANGSAATTLSASGLPQTGNQTFTYTPGNSHYMLTGNPYASPVDLTTVINNATGIAQQFWTWDPNRLGTSVGGYVTFTKVGSNYISDMDGQTLQTTVLQSGEAFFTQANTAGTVSIPFTEADKANASTSNNGVFFAPTPNAFSLLRVALNKNINNTMTPIDGVLALYNSGYQKDATDDVAKLYNYDENLSLRISNNYIAIQKAPLPQEGDSLWLDVYAMKAKNSYSFTFKPQNIPTTVQAWIVDRYLNTKTPVDLVTNTDVAFTTTADKPSYAETRFVVVFAESGTLATVMTKLKAWQQDKTVQVEWTTATEQGIQQYITERSPDGQTFTQIGAAVQPRNTQHAETYNITDLQPNTGDNYYRIKVQSKDAATAYSNVVLVKMQKGKATFLIYPNPVIRKQQLHFVMQNMDAGKYTLQLFGSDGKQLMQKTMQYDGNTATQQLKLPLSIATGSYRLVLLDEKGNEYVQQVMVQ